MWGLEIDTDVGSGWQLTLHFGKKENYITALKQLDLSVNTCILTKREEQGKIKGEPCGACDHGCDSSEESFGCRNHLFFAQTDLCEELDLGRRVPLTEGAQ